MPAKALNRMGDGQENESPPLGAGWVEINLLRYPHTGVEVQQHRALGMECCRILSLGYAAVKMTVKCGLSQAKLFF